MIFLVMMAMIMTRKKKKKNKKKTQAMHKPAIRIRNKSNSSSSSRRSSNNTNAKVQKFFSQLMHGNLAIWVGVGKMFEWGLHDRNAEYLCGSSRGRTVIAPTPIRLTRKKEKEEPGISSVLISRMLAVCRRM